MKERPILFNAEMIRAILDGRKTMTRRVVKGVPQGIKNRFPIPCLKNGVLTFHEGKPGDFPMWKYCIKCPYGIPGDRLWVREAFAIGDSDTFIYKESWIGDAQDKYVYDCLEPKWKPSIHMPRWASRITLEITDVRVERVQAITPKDALSEGIVFEQHYEGLGNPCDEGRILNSFINLWNSINEKRGYGWDVNPWVWVVEFMRVGGDGDVV